MPEPIRHTNRKGDCYTLFEGRAKTGKPKYFVSRKPSASGEPIGQIPEGYEIYENPNAGVSVRRIQPRVITDEEETLIKRLVGENKHLQFSKVEIERKRLVIYTAESNLSELTARFIAVRRTPEEIHATEYRHACFTAMLRFTLEDKDERLFLAERYCFRGSVDDWIYLDGPSPLNELANKFIPHLGRESFFHLDEL